MNSEKCKHDMKDAFEQSDGVYDHVDNLVDAGEISGSNRMHDEKNISPKIVIEYLGKRVNKI